MRHFLCVFAMLVLAAVPTWADGNVRAATLMVSVLGNGQYEIVYRHGAEWDADQGLFGYHDRLEHWRNGQLEAVLVDEDVDVEPHPDAVCPSCDQSGVTCSKSNCHYRLTPGKGPWFEGKCDAGSVTCPGSDAAVCTCKRSDGGGSKYLDLQIGDTVVFSVEPGPGFVDWAPEDDVLSFVLE
ncbi:MAG: hypothetical protein Kow0062_21500 [Acidobacteriota bacterium]